MDMSILTVNGYVVVLGYCGVRCPLTGDEIGLLERIKHWEQGKLLHVERCLEVPNGSGINRAEIQIN